jgi:hypothetical protein
MCVTTVSAVANEIRRAKSRVGLSERHLAALRKNLSIIVIDCANN